MVHHHGRLKTFAVYWIVLVVCLLSSGPSLADTLETIDDDFLKNFLGNDTIDFDTSSQAPSRTPTIHDAADNYDNTAAPSFTPTVSLMPTIMDTTDDTTNSTGNQTDIDATSIPSLAPSRLPTVFHTNGTNNTDIDDGNSTSVPSRMPSVMNSTNNTNQTDNSLSSPSNFPSSYPSLRPSYVNRNSTNSTAHPSRAPSTYNATNPDSTTDPPSAMPSKNPTYDTGKWFDPPTDSPTTSQPVYPTPPPHWNNNPAYRPTHTPYHYPTPQPYHHPTPTPSPFALHPTTKNENELNDKLKKEEEHIEKVAKDPTAEVIAAILVFLGIVGMLTVAYQVIENPDGLCANFCRLCLKCVSCSYKVFCLPCRFLCGGHATEGYDASLVADRGRRTHHDLELS